MFSYTINLPLALSIWEPWSSYVNALTLARSVGYSTLPSVFVLPAPLKIYSESYPVLPPSYMPWTLDARGSTHFMCQLDHTTFGLFCLKITAKIITMATSNLYSQQKQWLMACSRKLYIKIPRKLANFRQQLFFMGSSTLLQKISTALNLISTYASLWRWNHSHK